MTHLYQALLAGTLAGLGSGLLGVSSGGILVPVLALAFGIEQHLAQMISLAAQILPTSLPAVLLYKKKGYPIAWKAVVSITLTFILGGALGAKFATALSSNTLRWLFNCYLILLAIIVMRNKASEQNSKPVIFQLSRTQIKSFLIIGFIGGISSGLLGIGGGLAITALSIGLLHLSQHQAQSISLAVSVLPLTLPAVWVYLKNGAQLPWSMLGGVVVGMAIGTSVGAMFANKLRPEILRICFFTLIILLIIGMALKSI